MSEFKVAFKGITLFRPSAPFFPIPSSRIFFIYPRLLPEIIVSRNGGKKVKLNVDLSYHLRRTFLADIYFQEM